MSSRDDDPRILPAIECGATGYVLKQAAREEFCEAVRTAAKCKPLLAPDIAEPPKGRVWRPADEAGLS